MRIGELAARTGVPAKTIRYYEEIGLIPPPARTVSGYRDFGPREPSRLGFIRAAQTVGLSLGEIREILAFRDKGEAPCAHVTALIERRAADLSERIQSLERVRRDLQRMARKARMTTLQETSEGTYCHIIESQAVSRSRTGPKRRSPNPSETHRIDSRMR